MGVPFNTGQTQTTFNMTPAVSAGISAGSGAISSLINLGQAKKQRKHESELAKYSYEQERAMVKEQNEYNSIANQAKMYEESGFNKNLATGKFEPQSQIAKYNPPAAEYGKIDEQIGQRSMDQYQNVQMNNKQRQQMDANINATNAAAINTNTKTAGQLLTNSRFKQHTPLFLAQTQSAIAESNQRAKTGEANELLARKNLSIAEQKRIIETYKAEFLEANGYEVPKTLLQRLQLSLKDNVQEAFEQMGREGDNLLKRWGLK